MRELKAISPAPGAIDDLIARLEQAEGPSRDLDGAIWQTVGLFDEAGYVEWMKVPGRPDTSRDVYAAAFAPAYTSSLDTCCTLLRPGAMWAVGVDEDGNGCAEMPREGLLIGAATPALALNAATIRALVPAARPARR